MSMRSDLQERMLDAEPVPVRMMNTIRGDTQGLHDSLQTVSELRDWLQELGRGAGDWEITAVDLSQARLLRDSLRRLAAFTVDDPRVAAESPVTPVEAAVMTVNEQAAELPAQMLVMGEGRLTCVPARSEATVTAVLADIAVESRLLLTGPDAGKLRACLAPGCVRYFMKYHPRREWCVEACGNRVRAARYYERVRARRDA